MKTISQASSRQSKIQALSFSLIAAVVAAVASGSSAALSLPVWAMFVGWVAFFTQGLTLKNGIFNALCVAIGIVFGMLAAVAIGSLSPLIGHAALPVVVFVVAMVVLSLRSTKGINNVLCYFLGLVTFFASRLPPTATTFSELIGAVVLGSIAGGVAFIGQRRLMNT